MQRQHRAVVALYPGRGRFRARRSDLIRPKPEYGTEDVHL